MFSIPIIEIDEYARNSYLDSGFNPRKEDEPINQYIEEWYSMFTEIKTKLSGFWRHGLGDTDFFMSSDWVPDRFLSVEVVNERVICPALLPLVHTVVSRWQPDYSVDICNAITVLKAKDGREHANFNIFVEKSRILMYSESENLRSLLGV